MNEDDAKRIAHRISHVLEQADFATAEDEVIRALFDMISALTPHVQHILQEFHDRGLSGICPKKGRPPGGGRPN